MHCQQFLNWQTLPATDGTIQRKRMNKHCPWPSAPHVINANSCGSPFATFSMLILRDRTVSPSNSNVESPPHPHPMWLFGARGYKELVKVKWGHKGGALQRRGLVKTQQESSQLQARQRELPQQPWRQPHRCLLASRTVRNCISAV